jgi:hypothetical protein
MVVLEGRMDEDNDKRGRRRLENIKSYNIKSVIFNWANAWRDTKKEALVNGWRNSWKIQMVMLTLKD